MDSVIEHLRSLGYNVSLTAEKHSIVVSCTIAGKNFSLAHRVSEGSSHPLSLPIFFILNASQHMPLAHVILLENDFGLEGGSELGFICVGDHESLSINFDRPELVFEASLERHISMLTKAICYPAWNREELLREFKANWSNVALNKQYDLVLPPNLQCSQSLQFTVKAPMPKKNFGVDSRYIGVSAEDKPGKFSTLVTNSALSEKRNKAGDAVILPLNTLDPAPYKQDGLIEWYLNTLEGLEGEVYSFFKAKAQFRRNQFWLVFCADTPSGITWFGLHFKNKKKGKRSSLPMNLDAFEAWEIHAISVLPYSRDFVAPRGGAASGLKDKKVLQVGCGSVGGQLVRQLASSGVGQIHICDPDSFEIENLYRHCIPEFLTGYSKVLAMKSQIESQYLWCDVEAYSSNLVSLHDKGILESYDLIVIAIGSPTHERFFKDYLEKENIKVSVIYTWLEGYGVGGHAILDCFGKSGCLKCAYIDYSTGEYGLSSNLNFIEAGQELTINHAGCGQNFLPYSSNCSTQTALVASDLAVKFLLGRLTESSKVSWKGDDFDATQAGVKTTYRYKSFSNSLSVESLCEEICDCGGILCD
ncbi:MULTISPECIES: ThiF family adenylyltransferase [Vibrio]|uniref:ThiF family adenylyltransferase n=1 Tax=Vibrio TaxID=662 RepID=UPI002964737E|nr:MULTISPECIES: ThiF family adenylyltransferase [unclassified Vibrio]MDW1568349.1 ThiF family adenylyltransferase [Vibrio sp. YT-15]MDW3115405.1 ThiF family adenylyltransferase [Vibrio sp. 1727]HAV1574339.1 ThiF family adenylyltransferase [Vibrio parahaemolyticus]HAV1982683.1 ThiF family adenylyltransferase [Vibrio parahaemolyticus]